MLIYCLLKSQRLFLNIKCSTDSCPVRLLNKSSTHLKVVHSVPHSWCAGAVGIIFWPFFFPAYLKLIQKVPATAICLKMYFVSLTLQRQRRTRAIAANQLSFLFCSSMFVWDPLRHTLFPLILDGGTAGFAARCRTHRSRSVSLKGEDEEGEQSALTGEQLYEIKGKRSRGEWSRVEKRE